MASDIAHPELMYQMHFFLVKMQSLFFSWDILLHDVQHGDTKCTDQDEADERDVVRHELRQLRSDASWTSVDETRNVRSMVLVTLQLYKGLETLHHYVKRTSFSSCFFWLCLETLACSRSVDGWAKPSTAPMPTTGKWPLALLTRDRSSRAS